MEEKIEKFIASDWFGKGEATPDAYSTAWVARIANKEKNGPMFPKSVEYIRREQLSDGSWGAEKPNFIFDRILCTLIATICLKQWNSPNDQNRIERGVKFIEDNLMHLANWKKLKIKSSPGIELILPALIDESKEMGLEFGSENIIEEYRKEKEMKLAKIKYCELFKRNIPGFGSWYFNLEGLDSHYTTKQIQSMFGNNGLICDCYSATAFALFRGIDSIESFDQISKAVNKNEGGVTNIYRMGVFDTAWSINFLYFSGYPISNGKLENHIQRLASIWEKNEGYVSGTYSGGLPPDADDISNTLLVMELTNRLLDNGSKLSLMRYLRGEYFITFEAEMQPSLTTNLHCLITLGHFKVINNDNNSLNPFGDTVDKVSEWAKNYIIKNDYSFEDKWHLSNFYGMSRALLAFIYCDIEFSNIILDRIISLQNNDGGWGLDGSTLIESSYIIIAISHWIRYFNVDHGHKARICLKQTSQFMTNTINEDIHSFWIDKGNWSLIGLDTLTILCGRFALEFLQI